MRHLQYLLSIDYFRLPGEKPQDKSDFIASLTCVAGALNGSMTALLANYEPKRGFMDYEKGRVLETFSGKLYGEAFKYFAGVSNLCDRAGT